MTAYTFFGCAFTAYGTPLALFLFTISKDPVKVIILILSAFFWLLSLLLSAILWSVVTPLKDQLAFALVFSVLFQELFRYLIYLMLDRADTYLRKLTETEETQIFANKHVLAYTVGLGFGLMSGAFSLVNVLADSLGPGTLGQGASPAFFLVSSLATLAMVLLHTAWGVVFFHSLDTGTYWQTAYVVLTHLTVSLLSLLNSAEPGGAYYAAHLVPTFLLLLATGLLAARVAGASLQGVKRALACSPSPLAVPAEQ